jgi:hypothetical protein
MKTTYPTNPAASLLLAEIGADLHFVPTDTIVGVCIDAGLKAPIPIKQIVEELASQIEDNRSAVSGCIGIRLVEKIEKYKMINV